jgi:hypothetical protein
VFCSRNLVRIICLLALSTIFGQFNESQAQQPGFRMGALDLGGIQVVPAVKAGYKHISLNFNFPHGTIPWAYWFHRGALDFSVKNADLWIGAAAVTLEITPKFSLFVQAEANLRRDVNLELSEAPYDFFFTGGGTAPLHGESGNRLQWRELDTGAIWGLSKGAALVGGIKFDRLSLGITGPAREIVFFPGPEAHGGDLSVKLLIPYVGVQIRSSMFQASLVYSPLMWADMTLSLTESDDKGIPSAEEARFSFNRIGEFLEGAAEYNLTSSPGFHCGLWVRLTYVKAKGDASQQWSGFDSSTGGAFFGGFPESITDNAIGTLTRYSWAVGLSANLPF